MKSFLLNRKQRVVGEGRSSRWNTVVSGVPQGTVLMPSFFLTHVIVIGVEVSSEVSCFADDTKVTRAIRDRDQDQATLQNGINRIYSWTASNNMQFNCVKFRPLFYAVEDKN